MQKYGFLKEIKCILLAAGYGSRWEPLTKVIPKSCLPFLNIPFIEHLLWYLHYWKIEEIYVNLFHRSSSVKELLQNYSQEYEFYFSEEQKLLGTAGGVKKIFALFGESPALIINSDSFSPVPLPKLFTYHSACNADLTLCLKIAKESLPYTKIFIDPDNRISFTPDATMHKKTFFFSGCYMLSPAILTPIPENVFADMTGDVIQSCMHNHKIMAFILKKWWVDIGTPKNYLLATKYFLSKVVKCKSSLPWLPANFLYQQTLRTHGDTIILLGKGTKVKTDQIHGANVVGQKCYIAAEACLRNCVLLEESYVSSYARLRNCIIGPFVKVPAHAHYHNKLVVSLSWLASHDVYLPATKTREDEGNIVVDIC